MPPALPFDDAILEALRTKHRHLGLFAGAACRYLADVAPFAAISEPTPQAYDDLRSLLAPGESVWISNTAHPPTEGLTPTGSLPAFQMALPPDAPIADPTRQITRLTAADGPAMVALTNLAFPGFFRPATHRMGNYYGVRINGELIAMGGERFTLEGYTEISGVCTHPDHRGKGLATAIINQLAQDHRHNGLISWLHVGTANTSAVALYRSLGFEIVRERSITSLQRG